VDNPYKSPEYVEEPEPPRWVVWIRDRWEYFKDSDFMYLVSEFYPIPIIYTVIVGVIWLIAGLAFGAWFPFSVVFGVWVLLHVATVALVAFAILMLSI
jgi:hypothetical protein